MINLDSSNNLIKILEKNCFEEGDEICLSATAYLKDKEYFSFVENLLKKKGFPEVTFKDENIGLPVELSRLSGLNTASANGLIARYNRAIVREMDQWSQKIQNESKDKIVSVFVGYDCQVAKERQFKKQRKKLQFIIVLLVVLIAIIVAYLIYNNVI